MRRQLIIVAAIVAIVISMASELMGQTVTFNYKNRYNIPSTSQAHYYASGNVTGGTGPYTLHVVILNSSNDSITALTRDVPVVGSYWNYDVTGINTGTKVRVRINPAGTIYTEDLTTGADIPTLSEWAMIVFSVVLLGLMTWYVIRRKRAVHAAV